MKNTGYRFSKNVIYYLDNISGESDYAIRIRNISLRISRIRAIRPTKWHTTCQIFMAVGLLSVSFNTLWASKLFTILQTTFQFSCSNSIIFWLTHWRRVTHICVSIIGPDNGLLPGRRQALSEPILEYWSLEPHSNKLKWNFSWNSYISNTIRRIRSAGHRYVLCVQCRAP